MTFMFLIIILGATDKRVPAGFAPIAIGLGLTLIHLISIPGTNTSCTKHGPSCHRRRVGVGSAMDVLGGTTDWGRPGWRCLSLAGWREG